MPMDSKLRESLRHLQHEAVIALAILVLAVGLSYVEDAARYLKRPEWLCAGIETFSQVLFVIDAIYVLSIVGIAVCHSIKGRWSKM